MLHCRVLITYEVDILWCFLRSYERQRTLWRVTAQTDWKEPCLLFAAGYLCLRF